MTADIGVMLRSPEALASAAYYVIGVVCRSFAAGAAQSCPRFAVAKAYASTAFCPLADRVGIRIALL